MNFLAHLYLAGDVEGAIVGNFIGDFVKGKDFNNYPPDICKGIVMHRSIDQFTDKHPVVHNSTVRFREKYSHYAPVLTDIIYDHFLSINWNKFSKISIDIFIKNTYQLLSKNIGIMPLSVQSFLPNLIARGRLESYIHPEGIQDALVWMSQKTSLPNHTEFAMDVFHKHYQAFNTEFLSFFPEIIKYIRGNT